MLLSRFWYVLVAALLSAALFTLYLAQSMYNRAGAKVVAEGLLSDSQVVSWYIRNGARERAAQLIKFSLNPTVTTALAESSAKAEVPRKSRDAVNSELRKQAERLSKEVAFTAVFAVDRAGRVVGQYGHEQSRGSKEFELGGYPVVADALHGYVRDGAFVWDRVYLAVARPVEAAAGELPVGAVVGLRIIDEAFARDVSARTGAAVAFYRNGERVAVAVPDGFLKSDLDGIVADFPLLADDKEYAELGRSKPRRLTPTVGAVYSRLRGDAWNLGVGYVVGRKHVPVTTPWGFLGAADDKDKSSVSFGVISLVFLAAAGLGLLFSVLEHTRPLRKFAGLVAEFAAGRVDQVQASQVGGILRKMATDINDGVDHAVAKGGGSRRAADLSSVLGDLGDQPAMSAFSFPDASDGASPQPTPRSGDQSGAVPAAGSRPEPPGRKPEAPSRSKPRPPKMAETLPEGAGAAAAARVAESLAPEAIEPEPEPGALPSEAELEANWPKIYEEFLQTKQQCGESVETLTYAKFEGTLRKNQAAIQHRHNVSRVKFTVYVKEGKAALKASPLRG